ncbi:MAG: RagB/SusD family nutrient uptake outer membrane protein [Odoribacter sp.]|nr:RagB/SusD family nutrient uptake outer membrane protein [Odoribacter sp.]
MKKIKIFISVCFIVLFCSSCSDWLTVLPQNEQVSDEYWQNKEELESVLASGYVYLRQTVPSLIQWGELRAGSIYQRSGTPNILETFQIIASDKSVCNWENFYKVINMANSVLANTEAVLNIDETLSIPVANSLRVEAYFLRALSYFYLVRNWREAPLILESYVDDAQGFEKEKASEEELIRQIKKDINDALATGAAKEFYEESWATKGRATIWALYALMADVCLWTEDYAEAIIYCNNILDASSNFRPVFMSDPSQWYEMFYPGNSNESIFELQYNEVLYGQTNNLATVLFGNTSPTYVYTTKMLEDFKEETSEVDINRSVRDIYGSIIFDNDLSNSYETATEGYVWKYSGIGEEDQARGSNERDPNFIIYRVADIMLMKAEALVLNSSDTTGWRTAVNLVNQIRVRSNLPEYVINYFDDYSEADVLEIILQERNMELAAEGKRWYDLLRFGKRDNYKYRDLFLINIVTEYNNSANPAWIRSVLRNNDALYLPIWDEEIKSNPELKQNPYYDIIN